jgi:DNA invertase Pin-like site-specific DNA recombinase
MAENRVPGSEERKTEVMRIVIADSRELAYEYSKGAFEYDLKNGKHVSFGRGILRVWQKQGGDNEVLVGSLDCFARPLAELHASLSWLHGLGIRFIALHENVDVDPKTGAGKSFFDNLTLLAKAERNMNARIVRAGIARARSLGVQCGRPPRRFPRVQACQLRQEGLSLRAIGARLGVPASTVADALKVQKRPRS